MSDRKSLETVDQDQLNRSECGEEVRSVCSVKDSCISQSNGVQETRTLEEFGSTGRRIRGNVNNFRTSRNL